MTDESQTRGQLIEELARLRQRVEELEALELEARRTLELLSEKTRLLGHLFQSTTEVAIAATDLEFRITHYNLMAERFFGYTAKEVVGKTVMEMHTHESVAPERFQHAVEQVRREGEYRYTLTQDTEEGPRILESRVAGILDSNGELVGFSLFSRDTTKHRQAEEALRESERVFSELAALLPETIFETDADLNLTFVNEGALEQFGYTEQDLENGLNGLDMFIPGDRGRAKENLERRIRGEDIGLSEYTARRKDGRTFPVLLQSCSIYRDGEFAGLRGLIVDITERKRAEKALRESEKRAREQRAAIVDLTLEGGSIGSDLQYSFERLCEILSRTIDVSHTSVWKLSDDGTALHCLNLYEADRSAHSHGAVLNAQAIPKYFKAIETDGRIFAEDAQSDPRTSELAEEYLKPLGITSMLDAGVVVDGKLVGVVCSEHVGKRRRWHSDEESFVSTMAAFVAQILTEAERKQAEEALRESESRSRFLIERSPLGITLISSDGRNLYLNPAFESMFGYTLEDMPTGEAWFEKAFPVPEAREEAKSEWIAGLKRHAVGEMWPRTFEVTCKDGSPKTIHFKPVIMEDGQQLVMYEDVTAQKRMEEGLRRVQNLQSLGLLAGGIAHDFNNLLTGVIGNLDLLHLSLDKDSEEYNIVCEAKQAADRTKSLVHQLMTFAKGGAPLKEPASIRELLRETTELSLHGANTKAEFHFADGLPYVDVDAGQIGQVIQNLVMNADQAMPSGGTLRMSAESVEVSDADLLPLEPGAYVKVSVEDEGAGMSEDLLDLVFDPYFSTKETGHGLGLSIAYSIVQRHGGHIAVTSEVGMGTTFEFYLPASERQPVMAEGQETELSTGTGRVLLMDDEETIHGLVRRALEALGYEVRSVHDGDEALQVYRDALESDEPFDVAIMDLTIPGGMGGKEAVGKLHEIDPQARVIVSSGYASDPVMADFEEYGFAGRVAKPINIEDLADTVKRVLTEGE